MNSTDSTILLKTYGSSLEKRYFITRENVDFDKFIIWVPELKDYVLCSLVATKTKDKIVEYHPVIYCFE